MTRHFESRSTAQQYGGECSLPYKGIGISVIIVSDFVICRSSRSAHLNRYYDSESI